MTSWLRRYRFSASTLFLKKMSTQAAVDRVLPPSSIPIFTTVSAYRSWRQKAFDEQKSVGYVGTMGALHEGHLSLVQRSLAENDLTVVSIFVNPAQFAPHEDLTKYPRTLEADLKLLESQKHSDSQRNSSRTPSALFLPSVKEMYPSGITQDSTAQKGTFVEVKGFGDLMEGSSRPNFFRGVATVVTKLFNVIQPTNTYFGQKDIQQALLLRKMVRDLLISHPDPEHLHIVPTTRDLADDLALSSRNIYLSSEGRKAAKVLPKALDTAKSAWDAGLSKNECISKARELVEIGKREISQRLEMRLDYIEINDPDTFEVIEDNSSKDSIASTAVILSGALWIDNTRLIDNLILGDAHKILDGKSS